MVETPSRLSRPNCTLKASKEEDTEDVIKCSGKHCRSCSASFIADCVAICCCPCAVFNMLTLAFIKVPWNMGRRCLGLLKKKGRNSGKRKQVDGVIERDRGANKGRAVEGNVREGCSTTAVEEEGEKFCASVEADRVWLELYQVGHLGFGRVSFTGIQEKSS